MSAFRYDGEEINTRLANSEAKILHDAIKDKAFNHEDVIRILSTRSKMQLLATFNRYRDDQGTSITKVHVKSSFYQILNRLKQATFKSSVVSINLFFPVSPEFAR